MDGILRPKKYAVITDLKEVFSIMSIKDRVDATLKNLEGKAQEAMGEFTGDPKDQIEGKAKQAKARAMQAKENLKDEIDKRLD